MQDQNSTSSPCCKEPIQFHHFPTALVERPQWVLWKWEQRDGKLTKVLYQPNDKRAATNRPNEWSSLAAVQEARWSCIGRWDGPHYDGVGFVFTPYDPFVGIDLDKCRGEEWATDIIVNHPTYTEVTPSLRGFHLIGLGAMPEGKGRRKGQIEMYDRGRFFTMTGMLAAGSTPEPRSVQVLIDELLESWAPPAGPARSAPSLSMDTQEILSRAFAAGNGAKVAALYQGETTGYESHSEADMALVELLLFWTQDPAQVDALFRSSGLMSSKWDEPRGAKTYGEVTIDAAMATPGGTYRRANVAPYESPFWERDPL